MKRLIALGIFGGFLFFSVTLSAQVPKLMDYHGRLTDELGRPITTATPVRFSLYQGGNASTAGSGTLVYQENATITPDSNGEFSHLIGSGRVILGLFPRLFGVRVFNTTRPVFLEVTVDPSGTNFTLLPRKQIVTVGYSFKSELAYDADKVDGEHAAAFSPVGHHHDPDYVNEGQPDSVTSPMIGDGMIIDADINASANISATKINPTGLDADLLDGKDSLDFVHTAGDDMTGPLSVTTGDTFAFSAESSNSNGRGVYGYASDTTGTNYGVYGMSTSESGCGVKGWAVASSGTNYGVYGASASTNGRGVHGIAPYIGVYGGANATTGTTYGVYGVSASTKARGVYGEALSTSGTNYGVWGRSQSISGFGVWGEATATIGYTCGVWGQSASTDGRGVMGLASDTTGTNYGVYAQSNSTDGYGVYGTAPKWAVYGYATATGGTNYGVYGESDSGSGYGVYGTAPNFGVYGWATSASGETYGVYGRSDSGTGHGVYGINTTSSGENYGVYGRSDSTGGRGVYGYAHANSGTNYGVYGESDSSIGYGVYGRAPTYGVRGSATDYSGLTIGVSGITHNPEGYAIYGYNGRGGYAGYFVGNVHVAGGTFTATDKQCVQEIEGGKKVTLYVMESPEYWFEDFGSAELVNGRTVVPLERVFGQTVNTGVGYFVFLTPNGDCQGLYISRKDKDSFEVRELGGGTSNITFDYRIVAKRRGYEEVRLEEFTEPEQPPAEPNLPIEKK